MRVFLVISGFLITSLLLGEADSAGRPSLRRFYIRRVLRIFPVYFAFVAVVALLAAAHLYDDTWSSWIGSLTFTRNMIGRGQSLTFHLWSLSVEEQFYLIWPLTLAALSLWRRRGLAFAVLLVPVFVAPALRAETLQAYLGSPLIDRLLGANSIGRYADSLAMGCLGAFLFAHHRQRLRGLASPWVLVVAIAGASATAIWHEFGQTGVVVRNVLAPSVEAVLILVAIWVTVERRTGIVYRVLNAAPVVWLGSVSYSLYIWQQLFVGHFAKLPLSALAVYDWRVWWIPAMLAAIVSHYAIERPIAALKDRLAPAGK